MPRPTASLNLQVVNMYLNSGYYVAFAFVSFAFAIPLTAVSDMGFQPRSEPSRPNPHILITFLEQTNDRVCQKAKEVVSNAALVLPELKGFDILCGDQSGTQRSAPKHSATVSFKFTIPGHPTPEDVAFCKPFCTGTIQVKTGYASISGQRTTYGGKEITQMVTIDEMGLETPLQSRSSETASAPKSGTHIKVDFSKRASGDMTNKKIQGKVEKLLGYVPHGLPEMQTPLTFTHEQVVESESPLAISGFPRITPTIYFKFTPSPALKFCSPECDGRIWVEHDDAFVVGPKAARGNMKIERVIKIVNLR
ncbi:uncharacterized protein C8R40DRAFT_1164857 [Lentinula edodes]|uniref:uncharacterized protein n=1 Tax=Lentinula edodes TaxID=5353 RepID=UPI001E8D2660|nr:uncharacterized protein C8R40DRAFT_1164857 [Lentinula edodes]KAH7881433.1 hypothetical protein C8R40DRAFT_1164857 [Lentinula edodes]